GGRGGEGGGGRAGLCVWRRRARRRARGGGRVPPLPVVLPAGGRQARRALRVRRMRACAADAGGPQWRAPRAPGGTRPGVASGRRLSVVRDLLEPGCARALVR